MLFHVTWEFIDPSEEGARRSLAVFQSWQPAPGNEFKGFYGFPYGRRRGAALQRLDQRREGGVRVRPDLLLHRLDLAREVCRLRLADQRRGEREEDVVLLVDVPAQHAAEEQQRPGRLLLGARLARLQAG